MDQLLMVIIAALAFAVFIFLIGRMVRWFLVVGTILAVVFALVYMGVLG